MTIMYEKGHCTTGRRQPPSVVGVRRRSTSTVVGLRQSPSVAGVRGRPPSSADDCRQPPSTAVGRRRSSSSAAVLRHTAVLSAAALLFVTGMTLTNPPQQKFRAPSRSFGLLSGVGGIVVLIYLYKFFLLIDQSFVLFVLFLRAQIYDRFWMPYISLLSRDVYRNLNWYLSLFLDRSIP